MRTARSSSRPGGLHQAPPEQASPPPPEQTPPWADPPGASTPPPDQAHTPGTRHPTVNRMTNRIKNITLPQTSFAGDNDSNVNSPT